MTNSTADIITKAYKEHGCLVSILVFVLGLALAIASITGVLALLVWLLTLIGVNLAIGFGKLIVIAVVILIVRWLVQVLFK